MNDDIRPPPAPLAGRHTLRVIVVLEGPNDVEFLQRISRVLRRHQAGLPDLISVEQRGELVFVPFGGGSVLSWAERVAPFRQPELHLYDRELSPETELRRRAAERVNAQPGCQALLTVKRSLENYLHPRALRAAGGTELDFGDEHCVAERVAQQGHPESFPPSTWPDLPRRARKRFCRRAKRWLNRRVVERMKPQLLAEHDRAGEFVSWLRAIGELAGGQQ